MEPWNTKEAAVFWKKDLESYGNSAYVISVQDMIMAYKPEVVFELSIGNGQSFVDHLIQKGVEVHGCDISEFFIDEISQRYPTAVTYKAGYDDFVKREQKDFYDVVYCVRSSWYFADIYLALDNMIEVAKPGGKIIIDIMNTDSPVVKSSVRACQIRKIKERCRNIIKRTLSILFKHKYKYEVIFNKDKTIKPGDFEKYLSNNNLSYEKKCFEQMTTNNNFFVDNSMRYIYVITKPLNI